MGCLLWVLVTALPSWGVAAQSQSDRRMQPPPQKGAALGLYSEDPNWSYVDFIDEMAAAGVSHVSVVVPYYLKTYRSSHIYPHPRYTVPMRTVRRTIKDIRNRGMKVFLFPILRVEDQSDGGWRGILAPEDPDRFYAEYTNWICHFAELANQLRIPVLSVGSELSTLDVDEARWRTIIAHVRQLYNGKLTYSANWDHYDRVKFFDALDFAGVTGYFELVPEGVSTSTEDLIYGWRVYHGRLVRWAERVGRSLILTEVGYLSQRGTASWPWKEGADEPLDLEIQRRCYEAFRRIWNDEPRLEGAYFWNWFGWGGPTSKEYTPRNKPAHCEVSKWYEGTCPKHLHTQALDASEVATEASQ